MKRYIVLLLALALVASVASCGTKNDPNADIDEPSVASGGTDTGDSQQTEAAKKAEEEAAKKAAEEEAAKKAAEAEAAKKAEEEAAKKAEEEAAKKAAEVEAAKKAEEEAARKAAEDEAAKKAAEEAARKAAEAEAAKKAEEEAAKGSEDDNTGGDGGSEEKPVPPSGGIIVPGFGGIGGGGSDSDGGDDEAPVLGDGSGLVADLEAVVGDSAGEMMNETYALTDSNSWQITNWFPGMTVPDGTKFAANTPMIGSIAHVVLLIEVPDGVDTGDFAGELAAHANPRWQICVSAESTQYEVSGNRILFVMSTQEIADAIISAFNG